LIKDLAQCVRSCDLRGFTPLIIAAYNGQAETVDF